MTFLYSIFFGAGATALGYNTFMKRVGYTNKQNIYTLIGVVFVVTTLVFYTILAFIL